ncbi:MAG TPA: Gfo/Idh/MocA family oxidoreductase [Puia sp.]|nr:Gfo/Idh/MocA family oxidoreductase [Puia sp.]
MLETLLRNVNRRRKEQLFRSPLFHTARSYAFVGVGVHSLTNLYPLLRLFNIRLKYVCTRHSDWSRQLSPLFPDCRFTHDPIDIARDEAIAGVFVCADPDAHFDLARLFLGAQKPVFIEKPPCSDLTQLNQLLALDPGGICKVGLQRRYWPGNRYLQKKIRQSTHYRYHFETGPYPQGDVYTELFLHPLDYCAYLFGDLRLESFSSHSHPTGTTLQAHVTHDGGCSGLLELSTGGSWNAAVEKLSVHTPKEALDAEYPASVRGVPAPGRLLNLPTERLLNQAPVSRTYYSGCPSLIPALEYNPLVAQGFYHEIEAFLSLTEGKDARVCRNDLPSLVHTYELIGQFKRARGKA